MMGIKFTIEVTRFEKKVTELNTFWDVGLDINSEQVGNQYVPITVYLSDLKEDSDALALETAIKNSLHIQVGMMVGRYGNNNTN